MPQKTRDRTFFVLLALASLLLFRLLLPFAAVAMFATVVVLVTWPVYAKILSWVRRPNLAAVVTTVLLGVVVALPVTLLLVSFVRQAVEFGEQGLTFIQSGGVGTGLAKLEASLRGSLPETLAHFLPDSTETLSMASEMLQTVVVRGLQGSTSRLPSIVTSLGNLGVDGFVFLGAVGTLYVKGPGLLRVVRDLVPLEEAYVDDLFEVFADLANRAVGGSVAISLIQGLVATVGYAIVGVDGLVFFGCLTALFAFVPVVGGALIYLPLVALTAANHGVRWALFLLVWQIVLTAQVDTVLRPLFLRGRAAIHPLLFFMAVFGGLGWLGFPGALAGPLILVAFMALFSIYQRDFRQPNADLS